MYLPNWNILISRSPSDHFSCSIKFWNINFNVWIFFPTFAPLSPATNLGYTYFFSEIWMCLTRRMSVLSCSSVDGAECIRPSRVPMSSSPDGDSTSCWMIIKACSRHWRYFTMLCTHLAPPNSRNKPERLTLYWRQTNLGSRFNFIAWQVNIHFSHFLQQNHFDWLPMNKAWAHLWKRAFWDYQQPWNRREIIIELKLRAFLNKRPDSAPRVRLLQGLRAWKWILTRPSVHKKRKNWSTITRLW